AQLQGVPVESVVRFGAAADEIAQEAEAFGADLVAVTEPRRGWVERGLGSARATRPPPLLPFLRPALVASEGEERRPQSAELSAEAPRRRPQLVEPKIRDGIALCTRLTHRHAGDHTDARRDPGPAAAVAAAPHADPEAHAAVRAKGRVLDRLRANLRSIRLE